NSFTAADVATVSANLAIDDTFTLISGSKTPAIKDISESPVTIEDKTFTYQINMGSSKQSDDSDSVKFEVTEAMLTCGSVTLTVYANHGGGEGSTRILGVYTTGNKSSNYQYSAEVDGGGVVVTIEIDKAGTYYFGSSSSGLNFYYMSLTYAEEV
ncbi:MAG: hypothetical protein LUD19_06745, partial [Clostridia bacterium]|nr:hypothetical protein [Clostridia bacterium]